MILLTCDSTRARATSCRASATSPDVAIPTWLSILNIFSMDSGMISLLTIRLSHTRTTPSRNLSPAVVVPRLTDSRAYSTWNNRPSGLKVVMPWSYPLPLGCILFPSSVSLYRRFMRMRVNVDEPRPSHLRCRHSNEELHLI